MDKSTSSCSASVQDVKGLLQVICLSVSSKSKTLNALVLFDFASNHYWLSASLARRLDLSGEKIALTLNSFISTDFFSTDLVEITLSADTSSPDYTFIVSAYLKDEINVGTQKVDVPALQENYPYLEPIKPVRYSYSDIEMVIGQDFYHHIHRLIIFMMQTGELHWLFVCR